MGIGIEYRDSSKDDGNDEQPPKPLKNIDEKSPSGIGMLPHRLFIGSTLGSNGNLDQIGVRVAHVTIQMGIGFVKILFINRPPWRPSGSS